MNERRSEPVAPASLEPEAPASAATEVTLAELLVRAVKDSPLALMWLPWWGLGGKAALRQRLAQRDQLGLAAAFSAAGHTPAAGRRLLEIVSALRVQHWSKNLLVAVPAIAGQRLLEAGVPLRLAALFAGFSLCASALYLLNDLADLDADRRHPVKRMRPLAGGRLKPGVALALAGLLAAAGLLLVFAAVRPALLPLITYLAAGAAYSLYLKPLVLVDVFVLTGLYLLRLAAGHTVSEIAVSPWLFALAFFLLLSLALCKRAVDLMRAPGGQTVAHTGRGYLPADLDMVKSLGCCCGVCAALVLAIYTQSPHVHSLYAEPAFLLPGSPLLLLWICRMWLLAQRGRMEGDPLDFAMRDRFTYVTLVCGLLLLILARKGWIHIPMIG